MNLPPQSVSMPYVAHNDALISSRNNIHVRRIRDLQTREGRERTGQFLLEGIRPLAEAVRQNVRIETLLLAPELLTGVYTHKLVKQLRIAGTPCLRLAPALYQHISQAEEPQGIAAVVRQHWHPLAQVNPRRGLCWIAVEAVQSPGNLGTIIRSSEAVGGAGVILIGDAVDPFAPATVRASMGAIFAQKFVRASVAEFREWKQRRPCTLVGTSPAASTDYHAARYPPGSLLLMGCEKRGLSDELQSLCDLRVKIPMVGCGDSLNLAVATSLMLYELFNQRRDGTIRKTGNIAGGQDSISP